MSEPPDESGTALARYGRSLRRSRAVYFGAVAAIVVALAVTVGIAWSHGEVSHTTLRTVADAPPDLPTREPSATLTKTWSTTDRAADGSPRWNGTVVTYSRHTVRGRNARTGAQTWTYTRTDRTVCTVGQTGGVAIAIYRLHGNCDEVTALDAGTGDRAWTRTLDEDGMPVDGTPTVQLTDDTVLISTPSAVYAIATGTPGLDNHGGGIDRWTYAREGCRLTGAVLGSAGALIGQVCRHTPCDDHEKFCGQGPQLLLRGTTGKADTGNNKDQIVWNRTGDDSLPVSADDLVSALDPTTGALRVLSSTNGKLQRSLPLSPRPATDATRTVAAASDAELITIGTATYAVPSKGSRVRWQHTYAAAPVLTQGDAPAQRTLAGSRLTVPGDASVLALNGATGGVQHRYAVTAAPTTVRAFPLGSGFLVAGESGATAYR